MDVRMGMLSMWIGDQAEIAPRSANQSLIPFGLESCRAFIRFRCRPVGVRRGRTQAVLGSFLRLVNHLLFVGRATETASDWNSKAISNWARFLQGRAVERMRAEGSR